MHCKKVISLLIVLVLCLCVLPVSARAAADVEAMLTQLPQVEELKTLSQEEQQEVYIQTQAAYDAYLALSEEARAALPEAEEQFNALFAWFNGQVMAIEETAPAGETTEKKEIPWAYTALILALVTTFLQNRFIFNRRR